MYVYMYVCTSTLLQELDAITGESEGSQRANVILIGATNRYVCVTYMYVYMYVCMCLYVYYDFGRRYK